MFFRTCSMLYFSLCSICFSFIILYLSTAKASKSDYIIVDGFEIHKDDFEKAEKMRTTADKQDFTRSQIISLEYDLDKEEDPEYSKQFPNKCQVCRLFVEELHSFLVRNGKVIDTRKEDGKQIVEINHNLIYRALQDGCGEMKQYRVSRIRDFRYIKGGGGTLRDVFAEYQSKTKIKNWMYSFPESDLDDPTQEIQRLYEQCDSFLEDEEDRILNWFFKAQSRDPKQWLCADRILPSPKERGCLYRSTEIQSKFLRAIDDNYDQFIKRKSSDEHAATYNENKEQPLKVTLERETVQQEL